MARYPTGRLWRPWFRGVWWEFTLDNQAHIGITVQDEYRGLGESSGSDLTGSCAGADPGPGTAGVLANRTHGGGVVDHIRWDLYRASFKAVH